MDLKEFQALSAEEQCRLIQSGASVPEGAKCEVQMVKCSDKLIEVQNALKKELRGEEEGAERYKLLADILSNQGEKDYSDTIMLIHQAEVMHKKVIEVLVDAIDLRCDQEVSSQKGK